MPKRATSTSYGADHGNTPKGNDPKRPGPGEPDHHVRARAAFSWAARINRLEQIADGALKKGSVSDSIAALRELRAVGFPAQTETKHSGALEITVKMEREGPRRPGA